MCRYIYANLSIFLRKVRGWKYALSGSQNHFTAAISCMQPRGNGVLPSAHKIKAWNLLCKTFILDPWSTLNRSWFKSRLALCTCTHLLEFFFSDFSSKCYFPPISEDLQLLQFFMTSVKMHSVLYLLYLIIANFALIFHSKTHFSWCPNRQWTEMPLCVSSLSVSLNQSGGLYPYCVSANSCACQSVCLFVLFDLSFTFCLA